jgi:hypothetical protein
MIYNIISRIRINIFCDIWLHLNFKVCSDFKINSLAYCYNMNSWSHGLLFLSLTNLLVKKKVTIKDLILIRYPLLLNWVCTYIYCLIIIYNCSLFDFIVDSQYHKMCSLGNKYLNMEMKWFVLYTCNLE